MLDRFITFLLQEGIEEVKIYNDYICFVSHPDEDNQKYVSINPAQISREIRWREEANEN